MTHKIHMKEYIAMAAASLAAYFTPIFIPVLLIAGFDIIDFIVGVRAAQKRGEKFTMSRAWSKTLDKIIGQGAALLIMLILQSHFFKGAPLIWVTQCAIMWVEVKSIQEKVKELYNIDIFKDAIKIMKRNK